MQLNGLVKAEVSYDNPLGTLPKEVSDAIDTLTDYMAKYYMEFRQTEAINNLYALLRGDIQ